MTEPKTRKSPAKLWKLLKEEGRSHMRCVTCRERAYQTFDPLPKGLDPEMGQFMCRYGHYSYKIIEDRTE